MPARIARRRTRLALPALAAAFACGLPLELATQQPVHAVGTAPVVTSVGRSRADTSGGDTVTISGSGFLPGAGTATVTFGAYPATSVLVLSDNTINAVTPSQCAGTVPVQVTTPLGTSNDTVTIPYIAPFPAVTSLSQSQAASTAPTVLDVTGTGLTCPTTISAGGAPAQVVDDPSNPNTPTHVRVRLPAEAGGTTGDLQVTTAGGTSDTTPADLVHWVAPVPSITGLSLTSGPAGGGEGITITGRGLSFATGVAFGPNPAANVSVASDTQLSATVPPSCQNQLVTVTTAGGTSNGMVFDYVIGTPVVTGVTPVSGPVAGGNQAIITGSNLLCQSQVSFGGNQVPSLSFGSSDGQLAVSVPATSLPGAVDVVVTNVAGASPTSAQDMYSYEPFPQVTALSPNAGPIAGGNTVTLTGADFVDGTVVYFGNAVAAPGAVQVVSPTVITVTAPPAAGGGVVPVTVATPGGHSSPSAATQYAYGPPSVASLSVSQGPQGGATAVAIHGDGFVPGSTVRFGGQQASTVTVVGANEIDTVSPPNSAGVADVVVTTPAGSSATSPADRFTYVPQPVVTGLIPDHGSTQGGNTVVITGNGFAAGATVSFGGTRASNVTVSQDGTTATATVPATVAAGAVDVVVTTVGGPSAYTSQDTYIYFIPPSVGAVSPNGGAVGGGTSVTITGTHFASGATVSFGGAPATTVTVNSDASITAVSPVATQPGVVDVVVTTLGGPSPTSPADQFAYGVPIVNALSPTAGPTAGGTTLTITGNGYVSGAGVSVGGVASVSVTVNSPTSITALAPAGSAGSVDVTVTTAAGTSATSNADIFTYVAPPTVAGLFPSAGPAAGGTSVTVTGSNFMAGATNVSFGGAPAVAITVQSSTSLLATSPATSPGGVHVTVTTPGGTSATSSADVFTYDGVPTVTGVSPREGPMGGGTLVTITGTNFAPGASVRFGAATGTSVALQDATHVTAITPASSSSGTVDVVVTTPGGSSSAGAADRFTYDAVPQATSVSPAAGPTAGGTSISLTGAGFTPGSTVSVGGAAATSVVVASATSLTAVTPAHAAGTAPVVVTTAGGSSNGVSFTYQPVPTVTAVNPNQGGLAGGTVVQVSGTNFVPGSSVAFGGQSAANVTYVNSGTLRATSPAHAAGSVDVAVTTPGGTSAATSADLFTYSGVPSVTSVSPNGGPLAGGTTVTIRGTNFVNPASVSFGSLAATGVTVTDPTTITAVSPAAPAGVVDVTVGTAGGASPITAADRFAYGAPTVSNLSPPSAGTAGGDSVTITGTGFVPGATVAFGGTPATGVTVVSATTITVTTPAHAAGSVDVVVTTGAGSSPTSSADDFAFGAPTVTGLSPSSGTAAGGDVVTITGGNFARAVTVYFGAVAASSVQWQSSTTLLATTPAQPAGPVTVEVVQSGGAFSGQATYTYVAPPTVSAVSPAAGPTAGGTAVSVTGTNFVAGMSVSFGGTAATSVTVHGSTSLTATTPAEAAGAVTVFVTTVGGSSSMQSSAANNFTFVSPPTVASVSPPGGPVTGGTSVTIRGTNFTTSASVMFGSSVAAAVTVDSATQITATSPATTGPGVVNVQVTTPGGTSVPSNADRFGYGVPTVTVVTPNAGPTTGNTSVTLTGTDFAIGPATVAFGGNAATVATATSTTSITALVPAGTAGVVDVSVTTASGTSLPWQGDEYAYGPPAVTGLSPTAGPVAGGTTVSILGSGFVPGASVAFGSVAGQSVVVNSSTSITATAPAESAGVVDVTVSNAAGASAPGSADHYSYDSPPVVSGVSPTAVRQSGGDIVTVYGSNFVSGTAVTVGGLPAGNVVVQSTTQLTATAPASSSAGLVDVRVATPGGTSSTNASDTVYVGAPVVVQVSPDSGPGGTSVTISGAGLTSDATVWFGTQQASLSERTGTTIVAAAPASQGGSRVADITVRTPAGTSATSQADQYAIAAPVVTSVTPDAGPTGGGTTITVIGDGFVPGVTVRAGSATASNVVVGSAFSLTAQVPAGSGVVDVIVSNAVGNSPVGSADRYAYGPPTVGAVSPGGGPVAGGTTVTVTGANFVNGATVAFGGVAATSVTVSDTTTIVAVAPSHATATVDVTVTTPAGTSATGVNDLYSYDPIPSVASLSPLAGPLGGGTSVAIAGSGFTSGSSVLFGSTAATSVTYNGSGSLTAVSPAEPAGSVHVTVTTPGGISATSGADVFSYDPAPTVTQVSPNAGPAAGGTSVTITGSNFLAGASVSFGATAATGVTVSSATSITATSPAGSAGSVVDVVVTTPGGTSAMSTADSFAYGAPAITSVSPDAGPTGGGTIVTVHGTGFVPGVTVRFGAVAAISVSNVSSMQLTATSPAGSAGVVDVVVGNPAGTSLTGQLDQFAYGAPVVTGVSPDGGPTGGNGMVTITGTGFVPGATVSFGGTAGTDVNATSATQITSFSPAHARGAVDVTVTTAAGTSAVTFADSYAYGAPTVTGVSPNAGPTGGGTTVTITGTDFVAGATVQFGARIVTPQSVTSRTSITVIAPNGSGVVDVTVSTPGGTSAAGAQSDQFAYGPPTVSKVSPNAGPTAGGMHVTITGTGFVLGATVKFGSVTVTPDSVSSTTTILATSPAGSAGVVDVTITTLAGTSGSAQVDQFAYGPPMVSGVDPNAGPDAGGTPITITGNGFVPGATVLVGGVAATGVNVGGPTTLTAMTPSGGSGGVAQTVVDVVVTNAAGSSATGAADRFTYDSIPTTTGMNPVAGPLQGGNTVTINGTNLVAPATVMFGGNAGTSVAVAANHQSLTVVAPAGTVGGVGVTVTTPGGTTASMTYTYERAPTVTLVTPPDGSTAGGTSVTLTGTDFTADSVVKFDNLAGTTVQAASMTYGSPTSLTVTTPANPSAVMHVRVTTPGGTSPTSAQSSQDMFVFGTPTVTSVSPNAGPTAGGNSVTIAGTGFTRDVAVKFGNQGSNITINSPTQITATVPQSPAGTVDVTVFVNPANPSPTGSDDWYAYGAPVVSSLSTNGGPLAGGTTVDVWGSGFVPGMTVQFGATMAASWTLAAPTHIQAVSPAEPGGVVDVTLRDNGGTSATSSADQFVFGPPTVTGVSPNAAGINGVDVIAISGGNFVPGVTVKFGSQQQVSGTYVSANQVNATVPQRLTPGTVDIQVVTAGGTSATNSADAFTFQQGYWVFGSTGNVAALGGAHYYGQPAGAMTAGAVVGSAPTPTGKGYWAVGSDGNVYAFGDAQNYGSEYGKPLNKPIVGMAATSTGRGYWLVGADGGIFTFGDAGYFGSVPGNGQTPSAPISGIAAASDNSGYWLVGQDGGIFTFNVPFWGSAAPCNGCSPFLGIVARADKGGYWLVQQGGGIYTFNTGFYGSGNGNCTCFTSLAAAPNQDGYWELLSTGAVFNFGGSWFYNNASVGNAVSISALP